MKMSLLSPVPSLLSPFFAALAASPAVLAQGRTDYVNFESPVTKPVAIARIGPGTSSEPDPYLLVCNTPDNRVEIYDLTDPGAPELQERIVVGLEPVTVVYYEFGNGRQMMYTANWLGDSVTIVELFSTDHALQYKMIGTFPVSHSSAIDLTQPQPFGDEPVHLAVVDGGSLGQHLFVAKRSGSSISWLNPFTGAPKFYPDGLSSSANDKGIDLVLTSEGIFARELDGSFATEPTGDLVVEAPQMVLTVPHPVSSTAPIWVLAHTGGGSKLTREGGSPAHFNLDLWSMDLMDDLTPTTPPSTVVLLPEVSSSPGTVGLQLGTTNFSMEFDPLENPTETLYVVGAEARNSVVGNAALRVLDTGFVETVLYKVDISDLGDITVLRRDLNTRSNGAAIFNSTRAIVQATDVAFYEGDKVCLVGFGSDTFAIVDTSNSDPLQWSITRAAVPRLEPLELGVAGPRGVVVDAETDHAYVLNSIDHSLVVIDLTDSPLAPTVQPLNDMDASGETDHDPVPDYIRRGRKFLYSNLGSGRPTNSAFPGFVACASCHVDGRLDNLPWRLTPPETPLFTETAAGDPLTNAPFGFEFNLEFKPLNTTNAAFATFLSVTLPAVGFPFQGGVTDNAKGPMITQSLQGLMNFELETSEGFGDGATLYHRFSNAPYHWRGDQATFRNFNEAFGDLQNGSVNLTETQLSEYVEFINSIHYPPSSEQPLVREYSAEVTNSSGNAQSGFSQFMDLAVDGSTSSPESGFGGRSCSQCHELPFGGNNRWTTGQRSIPEYADDSSNLDDNNIQPLDTPALRGLRQKEQRFEFTNSVPTGLTLQSNEFGLGHEGLRAISINEFVGGAPKHASSDSEDMTAFIRQLDHGIAPIVGRTVTVTLDDEDENVADTLEAGWKLDLVEEMEAQARLANCGLAVHFYDATAIDRSELVTGFWYAVEAGEYREEGTASTDSTRAELIGMLVHNTALRKDTLVFTATPLGSERRVASLSGTATHPDNTSPAAPDLIGTTPNTANLIVLDSSFPSATESNGGSLPWTNSSPFLFPEKQRVMEHLRAQCMALSLVPSSIVHDAPRRLKFTGEDFKEGGKILFGIPIVEPDATPIDDEFVFLTLPIYPTDSGHWETNVEFEPYFLYMLLLGGPNAPDVVDTLDGNSPTFSSGDVDTWNQYRIRYVSPNVDAEPGEVSSSVLVPLVY